jgi:amidase
MRAPLRRPLGIAVLLALLLSISTIGQAVVLGRSPTSTRVAGINVDAKTIVQLQRLMDRHRLTSVQLTQFYLHRIKKLNPMLNAVITVSPTARSEARAADKARRKGDDRPLLGIPILVKDNVNTTGMPTTAGSWALAGSTPSDAFIVQQLRAAGAIVIGKANLSEWANFRSIPSSSGWSGIGGQTNMAHVLDRNPCGSSSGSGVAAAADLAVAAIGTETDGSIVCPSGANGIVGIKPTLGLLSRAGIIPISADQDTAGPMTRNVTDAAVLLGALTGIDPDDPATSGQAGNAFTDYTPFLDDESLEGARIGVWSEGTVFAEDPDDPRIAATQAVVDDAIAALEAEGATIVDGADIDIGPTGADELFLLECEFKTDIAAYLQTYVDGTNPVDGQPYAQTLADLIAFNLAHQDIEGGPDNPDLPWNNAIWDAAEATGGRADPECQSKRAALDAAAKAAIDDLMAELDLDAIVAPTNGPAWPTDPINGDDFSLFIGSSSPSAVAGYASITVPAGYVDDVLPIGISFIGGQWDEPELIGFAFDFEDATEAREPPQFIPTIGP